MPLPLMMVPLKFDILISKREQVSAVARDIRGLHIY